MQTKNDEYKVFVDFLNSYNECFYEKDIEKLKRFYDWKNNRLIYIDNHKNNDTYNLEQHLNLLSDFFKNGKKTESGDVEPLEIENLNIFYKENTACLFYIAKYKSFPDPAVANVYINRVLKKSGKLLDASFMINMANNSPAGLKPFADQKWVEKISKDKLAVMEDKVRESLKYIVDGFFTRALKHRTFEVVINTMKFF